jgi:DNA-binding MarR family transcriptional regulator
MSNNIPITLALDFETRYPDSSARATECAMNLVRTADQLEKQIAGLLQPFDLSPATGLVLSILAEAVEPVSPNLIADRLIISRASVTSLLDSLEKRGYVRRQPHHSDRRMLQIELTLAGRKVADQFRPVVHHQQKEWLNVLTDEEQAQLIQMLHRVQASLTDSAPLRNPVV